MAKQLRWSDLRIGLLAAAVVVSAATVILAFGRVGTLHGKTFRLYVATNSARGVINGTEVWLDGEKVGLVRTVNFRPPTVSAKERLVIVTDLLESAQDHIRRNALVQIRSGTTLIGDQVVNLSGGTAQSPPVRAGDTLLAVEQPDNEHMMSEMAAAAKQFPPILQNVKVLAAQLQSTEGTLGAFGLDHGNAPLARIERRTERLLSEFDDSTGALGMFINGSPELEAKATHATAQLDSIRTLLASKNHSLGRFRRDSTLKRDLQRIRAELVAVGQLANSPQGTVGRLRADSAITVGVRRSLASIDSLFADMKKRPLRYIAF